MRFPDVNTPFVALRSHNFPHSLSDVFDSSQCCCCVHALPLNVPTPNLCLYRIPLARNRRLGSGWHLTNYYGGIMRIVSDLITLNRLLTQIVTLEITFSF